MLSPLVHNSVAMNQRTITMNPCDRDIEQYRATSVDPFALINNSNLMQERDIKTKDSKNSKDSKNPKNLIKNSKNQKNLIKNSKSF